MVHTLWNVLFSGSEQIYLLAIAVSLTEFLQWDIRAWASLGPEARFWLGSISGERSWRTGGIISGKNVPKNPLHNLPEILLNTWPVLTVFIGLILGAKKIKDRRTLISLGLSYWDPADSGALGTHWGVGPARVPQLHPLPLTCSRGIRGNKKWRL